MISRLYVVFLLVGGTSFVRVQWSVVNGQFWQRDADHPVPLCERRLMVKLIGRSENGGLREDDNFFFFFWEAMMGKCDGRKKW
ncbi:hypothetical protein QR685DRAFT_515532 [Neurospora intermedia]|uniref:Secreted protein n=1 Tax=Neurospora intermedia TaxID=5142 RepID=A0ABR3DK06_NEUIN